MAEPEGWQAAWEAEIEGFASPLTSPLASCATATDQGEDRSARHLDNSVEDRMMFRAECDALFRRIDKDGDGRLTKKEIKSGLAAIQAQTGLIRSAKEVWKAADADGSKSVDRAEFFEFMSSHQVKTGSTDGHSAEVANAEPARSRYQ